MNLSKSLLSLLVASTMVLSITASATTDMVAIQKGSIDLIATESANLKNDGAEYTKLTTVLGSAKKSAAGYRIDISTGGKLTVAGVILLPFAGGARAYAEVTKQVSQVKRAKSVLNILVALGAVAFVGGYGFEKYGASHIDASEADVIAAVEALNQKRADMEFRRSLIAENARKLGGTVNENITTHQNIMTITGLEGLKQYIGSGVMTLPIPMPIQMPMISAVQQ